MKLFLLTDTRIIKLNNNFYIFNSVKYELEAIESLFTDISILGCEYNNLTEINTLEKCSRKWEISLLRFPQGKTIVHLLFFMFKLFVLSFIKIAKADVIHVRGPGIPMFVGLFYSIIFPRKTWWFKYANDWSSWGRSGFWDMQKKLLLKFKWIKVTINGNWPNQPAHIVTFENPCVWLSMNKDTKSHEFNPQEPHKCLKFIFVGRLTEEKGALIALRVLQEISKNFGIRLQYTVVGQGPLEKDLIDFNSNDGDFVLTFLGTLSKLEIFEYYKSHDFIILPTLSPEGFPKSIAEGMSFGCIPIVTSISSIPQYITHFENGLLLSPIDIENNLYGCISELCFLDKNILLSMKKSAVELSDYYFTYERFSERVNSLVLK